MERIDEGWGAGVRSSIAEGVEGRRVLAEIRQLSLSLQERRHHPLLDGRAQRDAIRSLEQRLAASWTELRAARAGPRMEWPSSAIPRLPGSQVDASGRSQSTLV